MKLLKFTYFILSVVLLSSCAKDEEYPTVKEYPILKTISAVADSTGVSVKGEILALGAKPITEYGFIYTSLSGSFGSTQKKVIGTTASKGIFEGRITADILKNVDYEVQAYARIEGSTIYGGKVGFKGGGSAAPVVNDFFPKEGYDETLITITGSNFSEEESLVSVKIGNAPATVIDSEIDKIIVKSPRVPYIGSFPITVTIHSQQVITKDKYTITGPYISHLSASKAKVGDEITLYGDHFFYTISADGYGSWGPYVYIGDKAAQIKSRTKTEITVIVPTGTPYLYNQPSTVSILGWNKTVQLPNALTIESGFRSASVLPSAIGATQARMPSFVVGGKAFFFDFDHLISYEIATGNWKNEGKFPATGVYTPVIEQVGDKVYLLGGRNGNTYYGNVWEYDHLANTWTKKPHLPFAVYGATSFVLDNKIYFFGGQNSNHSRRLWQYDPSNGDLFGLNLFPVSTYSGSAFKSGSNIYAVANNILWAYDAQQDSWLNKGNAPSNSVAFTFNNKGYAVSPNNDLGLSWYNEAENKWIKVANYPGCVNNSTFSGFAYENKLYIASFGNCSSTLYYYQAP